MLQPSAQQLDARSSVAWHQLDAIALDTIAATRWVRATASHEKLTNYAQDAVEDSRIMHEALGTIRLRLDDTITRQQIKPGTIRRVLSYVKKYRWAMVLLLGVTVLDAVITAANPVILGMIINDGITRRKLDVVVELSVIVAGLALLDALAIYIQTWGSARIGQGLIHDLRTSVFDNVRQQPLAFFTRSQTGALLSRISGDIMGAQQVVTSLLSQTVSTFLTLILVLAAMFYLSWQISLVALVLIPFFVIPGKLIGKRLQRLTREQMQLDAGLTSLAAERFNVGGAMLAKLYGRPAEESDLWANQSSRLRDIAVANTVYGRAFFIVITLLAALATAMAYGLGGNLVISGAFNIGTLVALVTLLARLYGPINQLSSVQVNVLTSLVSFDRVFEVMDLKPLITARPGAYSLPRTSSSNGTAPGVEFDRVSFRYPTASEVSLASLESIALPLPERGDNAWVLSDLSFRAFPGQLTALVGHSGAGKTTITHLVPRMYDPTSGTVRIDGHDIRDLTLESLHETVGVVTQDAHLFHDTIRANLVYARPGATEQELAEACDAARIWDMIRSLPNGLDTVVGDQGYRLSGGEKQRISLARLLLKAPPVVVLDEATAHLDSESEAAIQRALKTALAGRTSLVIAHRLSTIREADQILVIDSGRVRERGTHEELLMAEGLYTDLYRTQFARQATGSREPATSDDWSASTWPGPSVDWPGPSIDWSAPRGRHARRWA
jgi:ATP-binding cassette subfamily B protein